MHQGDIRGNGELWIPNRSKSLSHQIVLSAGGLLWFLPFFGPSTEQFQPYKAKAFYGNMSVDLNMSSVNSHARKQTGTTSRTTWQPSVYCQVTSAGGGKTGTLQRIHVSNKLHGCNLFYEACCSIRSLRADLQWSLMLHPDLSHWATMCEAVSQAWRGKPSPFKLI